MLSHLQISNFTLVDQLELEFHSGLSVLTGETGAGKSILIDALGLILGDRADADKVKAGADKADLQASFNLNSLPFIGKWLDENELGQQEDECLLRRVITSEGRSRAFINGQSVTLQQLKTLGDMLVNIHGQHEHQSLIKASSQMRQLDEFGQLRPLVKELKRCFYHWHGCKEKLELLKSQSDEVSARFQLLTYQVSELNSIELKEGEILELEDEQKRLENVTTIKQNCQHVSDICEAEEDGLIHRMHAALKLLGELDGKSETLLNAESMIEQALINVQEAHGELLREQDDESLDPSRLPEIESRLSAIYEIARKHRTQPEKLLELHQNLNNELRQLGSSDSQIEALETELAELETNYTKLANKLSSGRKKFAAQLCTQVNKQLSQLAMAHASFHINLDASDGTPRANGNEDVHFLISTTPGQPPKPIVKIASGGELSRISLAIQVVTAKTSTTPTLIFDEVDVGIGGTTGDMVGLLLRELGGNGQVLCVTHLAQVASKAHQHMLVEKTISKSAVSSSLKALDENEKVREIARMMGGAVDSKQSLAHAKEMLETA